MYLVICDTKILYHLFLQGDEILSVNGVNIKGKSAFDVSSLLQGRKGTFVTLEVSKIIPSCFLV